MYQTTFDFSLLESLPVGIAFRQWLRFGDCQMRFGLVLSAACFASPILADDLTIMNWNIANLASEIGVSLRDGGHTRTEEDYERIREIIAEADPDIIALQEIGSIAAARSILGEDYDVYFESRCSEDICDADHGDIYTAIAHRSDFPVKDLRPVQIDELSVLHIDECGGPGRFVRGGVGLSFMDEDAPFVVASVHLKASCASESANDPVNRPNVQDDCAVLDEQFTVLAQWMEEQTANGVTVVVAGDYNRQFLEPGDRHMAALQAALPSIRVEPREASQCWPQNYPQSRSFRVRQLFETFGTPMLPDGTELRWAAYMPSSIGSRDFFLVAGPEANRFGEATEILMRPQDLVHDPEASGLSVAERIEIEEQAASFGVRFDAPSGYISSCDLPATGELPPPEPFFGGNTVLGFQNVYPSDHCPITLGYTQP